MDVFTEEYAKQQDERDPLRRLREYFVIPSKADLARKTLTPRAANDGGEDAPSIYLCGNSLGLQPTLTRKYMQQYLDTWATKGVYGHFKEVEDSNLAPWLHVDDDVLVDMAKVVGALPSEVAVMQTLTANLHLMLASFYQPTKERYKVILEGKAFPSDHYAVESHIRHHGLDPADAMVLIEPESGASPILSTHYIRSVIDKHASNTALLLLPGIQFYTGQLFDMLTITDYAHTKGITVGWDLAHAAGNVPLQLHDWDVDFAVWCTYKYINCGPGSIGGAFVHERHGKVKERDGAGPGGEPKLEYRPRLSGWWGSSKSSRFAMTNRFHPTPGAAGFQLSNPSVADTTAVRASLDVFKQTSMAELRQKSIKLTKYLEKLLDRSAHELEKPSGQCFSIITPRNPDERGAQLSVLLKPGMLDSVMESLEEAGVVVDERRPDVIRVAPTPLYNTFQDVFLFAKHFQDACEKAVQSGGATSPSQSIMADGGKEDRGWSEIK
ncbi:Kynureninase 1 [Oleoguttula mirabilis]|uniref:Kynureninase n=1 Tax=Oleoguttula mirabilis TaxID=1507867 RepID=A0AAV9JQP9_9PEZI|nr:Kynureninase 1 [Oleoguttula mirabilis]